MGGETRTQVLSAVWCQERLGRDRILKSAQVQSMAANKVQCLMQERVYHKRTLQEFNYLSYKQKISICFWSLLFCSADVLVMAAGVKRILLQLWIQLWKDWWLLHPERVKHCEKYSGPTSSYPTPQDLHGESTNTIRTRLVHSAVQKESKSRSCSIIAPVVIWSILRLCHWFLVQHYVLHWWELA